MGAQLFRAEATDDMAARVREVVRVHVTQTDTPLSRAERLAVISEVSDDILGYGPIDPFLRDDSVTEIMVNGFDSIYIERSGAITRVPTSFLDDDHVIRIIDKIVAQVGRRIDEGSPMVDARLRDGSRVNAIIPPLALDGPVLTVRKFARQPYLMEDLARFGTVTLDAARLLAACVEAKLNILVCGGTGVGKTTMLNALSRFIGDAERIITIEDAAELQLQQRHVVRLESRPENIEHEGEITIRDLVRNALRMRPDRIVVGEVRGAETFDMLQAMNTGHAGSLTTVHANSPRDALYRIEMLVLTSGVEMPLRALREQIARAFDVIVHLNRTASGARRVTHIAEVLGTESEMIQLQDIFVAPGIDDTPGPELIADRIGPLQATGVSPTFASRLQALSGRGLSGLGTKSAS
jgi:pilus assembly protein CpaF